MVCPQQQAASTFSACCHFDKGRTVNARRILPSHVRYLCVLPQGTSMVQHACPPHDAPMWARTYTFVCLCVTCVKVDVDVWVCGCVWLRGCTLGRVCVCDDSHQFQGTSPSCRRRIADPARCSSLRSWSQFDSHRLHSTYNTPGTTGRCRTRSTNRS